VRRKAPGMLCPRRVSRCSLKSLQRGYFSQHCSLERGTLIYSSGKDSGKGILGRARSFGIIIRAWRSHGCRRVRQRSSRVDVLFLLAAASLHRARHRSSRVAVASLRLLCAAAAFFSRFLVFSCVLSTVSKFEAGR
jgi:hypothetical protein